MATIIKIRRGTKSELDNIVLSEGEIGFTTDTHEVYIGDGSNHYLVGKVMVDNSVNRPDAGISGRMFYAPELSATYVDDGEQWVDISTTIDESEIDHNSLLNYDVDEHVDHKEVNINVNAPLTGGGDISSSRTIGIKLLDADLGVNASNKLYIKDSGVDHDSLTNTHQDVTTDSSPTFNSITINSSPSIGSDATTKDYVDNLVQGVAWQEAVISVTDFTTSEPTSPTDGDRYINDTTGNTSTTTQPVTADFIYEWNESETKWESTIPEEGFAIWVEDENVTYVYNGSSWTKMSSVYNHNNLSNLQGGTDGEYYHLDSTEYNYLNNQDQSLYTTSSPTFNDLTITDPTSIYSSLSLSGFQDYDDSEFIDWTVDQGDINIHEENITEISITQHETAIDHDRLKNYSENEHVDHSSVTISTGNGLTGGGDITASRTLSIKNDTITGATVAPFNISGNGVGVSVDNSSIRHSSGELYVYMVDGGIF